MDGDPPREKELDRELKPLPSTLKFAYLDVCESKPFICDTFLSLCKVYLLKNIYAY